MRIPLLGALLAASAAAAAAGAPTHRQSRRRGPVRKDAVHSSTRGLLRRRALQAPAMSMLQAEEAEDAGTGPYEFDFVGPVWTALQYRDPATGALVDVLPIEGYGSITLRFDGGGRLSGNGGCNNYFGGYTDPTEETLTIDGPVTTTLMLCESKAINDQERKYLGLLAGTLGWAASAARLELSDAEGNVVLNYGALPEGTGSPETLPAGVPDATTEPNVHMTLPAMDGIDGMEGYDPFLGLTEGSMPAEATVLATVAPSADTTEAACQSIVEIAASEDSFSTLVAAVTAAGLVDALSGEGPLTVFAPTNEAFAALPEGALDALLADPYALAEVLKYHVVPTEALSSGLELSGDNAQKCGASGAWRRCRFETLNGDLVAVFVSENGARVNEANVIAPSPVACNGVVHVIDKVLVPPAGLLPPKPSTTAAPETTEAAADETTEAATTSTSTTPASSKATASPSAPPTASPTKGPTPSPSVNPTSPPSLAQTTAAELVVFPWVDEGASEDDGWGGAAVYEMSVKAKSSKHATFMSLGTKAAKPAMSLPTTKPKAQKEPGFGKSGKRSKKMGSKSAGFSLSLPVDVPSSKGGKRAKSSSKGSKSKGQTAILSRPEGLPGLPPDGSGPKPKSGKSVFGPKPKGDKIASTKSAKGAHTAFGEATLDAKAKKVSSSGKTGKKDADAHSMALVDDGWQGSRRQLQEACAFCPSGIPIPFFPLPSDLPLPDGVGATCETAASYAETLLAGDADCAIVREAMALCCPNDVGTTNDGSATTLACPETLGNLLELDEGAFLYYALVPSTSEAAKDGIFCARLEVAHDGWVGLAFSPAGTMEGSTGVIGVDGTVRKYDLQPGRVTEAEEARQTLIDASVTSEDGVIVMTFGKLLEEEGDVTVVEGSNTLLHARGDAELGYHGAENRFVRQVELITEAGEEAQSTTVPATAAITSSTEAAQTAASSVPSLMPSGAPSSAPSEMPSEAPTQLPVTETLSTDATTVSSSTLAASTSEPTTSSTQAGDVCSFCPGGIPIPNFPLPTDEPGATCETAATFAATLLAAEANCTTVKLDEPLCCPDGVISPATTAVPQTTTAACQSIADIVASSGNVDFSILMAAIAAANLTETLSGEGPLTVFAPTDEAFAALPEGALDLLLADPDALAEVLEYHVVAGNVLSSDLENGNVETLSGESVAVLVLDEGVMINDALVTSADILACNGVIHVINKVLLPPTTNEDSSTSSTLAAETTAVASNAPSSMPSEMPSGAPTQLPVAETLSTEATAAVSSSTLAASTTEPATSSTQVAATTTTATDAPDSTTTETEPTDMMTEPSEPEPEEASRDTESSVDSPAAGVSGKAAKRSKKRSKAAGSKASSTASTTAPKSASKSGKKGGGEMSIGSAKSSKLTKQSGHSSSGKSHKEQTAIFFRPGSLYGAARGKAGKEGLSMPSSKSSKTLERPAPKGGTKSGNSAAGPKPKSDKVGSSKSAKGAHEAFGEATIDAKAKKVSSGKAGKKEAGAAQSMPTMDDGWQGSVGEEKLPPRR